MKKKLAHLFMKFKAGDVSWYRLYRNFFPKDLDDPSLGGWIQFITERVNNKLGKSLFGINKLSYSYWMNHIEEKETSSWLGDIPSTDYTSFCLLVHCEGKTDGAIDKTISSIQNQSFSNWKIVLFDSSIGPTVSDTDKITTLQTNDYDDLGSAIHHGIVNSSATWAMMIDAGDILAPHALSCFAARTDHKLTIRYADQDSIDLDGKRSMPVFKPHWSPESLLSRNYIGRVFTFRVSGALEGVQFNSDSIEALRYRILLRLSQMGTVEHLPFVLLHTIEEKGSETSEATSLSNEVKNELEVRGLDVEVEPDVNAKEVSHVFHHMKEKPLVSVIIPAHNKKDITHQCLKSLFEKTDYSSFEVIVISNNSTEGGFYEMLDSFKAQYPERFKWLKFDVPFNYSKIVNHGLTHAKGELLLHLNNDIEIIHSDWMNWLVSYASQKEIGAVGAKLLYPNQTIQHVGVTLGIRGVAMHINVLDSVQEEGTYLENFATTNYAAVTGACLMVSRTKYEEVGGFEEEQVVEFNDVDFCLKLLKAGYRNVVLPSVTLIHYESISRGHPMNDPKSYERHIKDLSRFKTIWKRLIENDPYSNRNLNYASD